MNDTPKALQDVMTDITAARLPILVGLAAGLVLAGLFIFAAVPHYRAQMMISPANPVNGAQASSLLDDDSLFAVRYLMERVGVSGSSDFVHFEHIYTGPSVAEKLLEDPKIMAGLALDRNFRFSGREKTWSPEKLSEYIARRVRLEPVGTSDLRRMTYLHPSPAFGKYFLEAAHRTADDLIRKKLRDGASARMRYLEATIKKTANPEHRRALTALLLEQERLRMLVSIESPYAAAIIEPASAGFRAAWPSGALVFAGFAFVGALLGFVWHGAYEPAAGQEKKRGIWFKTDSTNANHRPLTGGEAADEPRKRA